MRNAALKPRAESGGKRIPWTKHCLPGLTSNGCAFFRERKQRTSSLNTFYAAVFILPLLTFRTSLCGLTNHSFVRVSMGQSAIKLFFRQSSIT